MHRIYTTNNLDEAIELATKFQQEGKYNLFRGQAQDWPMIPSMGRVNKSEVKEIQEKITRLAYFFECEPTLNKYKNDVDWFFAVAQHYGLPTMYIDFSTSVEVSAYFATNSKSNKVGTNAVIICLNETVFNNYIESILSIFTDRKVIPPYLVNVNVENLWRLQAQKGRFLFTPFNNLESIYPFFDRIVFPFTYSFTKIVTEDIYPTAKSELEIMLDHYFDSEVRIIGQKRFDKLKEEVDVLVTEYPAPNIEKSLKQNMPHSSWTLESNKIWNFQLSEEWQVSESRTSVDLICNRYSNFNSGVINIFEQITQLFEEGKLIRNNPSNFNVTVLTRISRKNRNTLVRSCNRIWSGTRNLPFSNEEIALIMSTYINLELLDFKSKDTFSISGEKLVVLELTNEYGSITRAYASPSKIISSFREDISEIVIDDLLPIKTPEVLLYVNKPSIIFDFDKLLGLFKEEIIAYQVLYNSEKDNPVIFYSPKQVSVLGYA